MPRSRLFEALARNDRAQVKALLKAGQSLGAGEYALLTGEQRELLERIKSEIARELDDDFDEDDEPDAPCP